MNDEPTAGDPAARPSSFGLAIAVAAALVVIVLAIWYLTTPTDERAPDPAGGALPEGTPTIPAGE